MSKDRFEPYSTRRKIDPGRGRRLADNTPNDADRVEIGPTRLAYDEWAAAGLALPDLQAMRRWRWQRLVQAVQARGWGGLLIFDPLNIRYATDSTNMQLWNTHNPFRAVLVCADGYMVIWDYRVAPFLSGFNPLVREQRSGADLFYFSRGDGLEAAATVFAGEVRDLLADHGGGEMRLDLGKGIRAQRLGDRHADNVGGAARDDRGQPLVGIGVAAAGIHMRDMRRHHLGGQPGAGLDGAQLALGFLQRADRRGQLPVGPGQLFRPPQHLFRQKLGAGAQQLLLLLGARDVGVDGDPAALRQRRPLDRDPAAVGAGALHVMRFEGAGLFDPDGDKGLGVADLAVFAARHQMADRVLEAGADGDQRLGQIEHLLKAAVALHQPQVATVDRQRLLDQVQPGLGHG